MANEKTDKQLVKRKKFIDVDVPVIRSKIELIGDSPKVLVGRTVKLDMTRQLKGKSVELTVKIKLEGDKPVAHPDSIKLMSYFIRRMIRKRISYVEDSFDVKTQESLLKVKPFLITKRRVSRAIRKTLRNKTKNWLEDYLAEKKDGEIYSEILSNKLQKNLSLVLKKTYPLSLCEIRTLEFVRTLNTEEVPKIKPKDKKTEEKQEIREEPVEFIDQMKEIEDEKIRNAEKEIKETQEKAAAHSKSKDFEPTNVESSEEKTVKEIKEKKPRKKKVEKA